MGRPPCCDKVGVKKGPWTPEEDIMLMSFVQEHGPGNWRAVPTKTGLKRCSKSCRLRWTNYLRPGIKRGSFNDQEEKMIIQLQALLGNKWAAIASYLPERTDNDIKNYWNTHLKKKLNKLQNGSGTDESSSDGSFSANHSHSITRGQWERTLQADINTAKQALHDALLIEDNTNDHLPEILTPSNDKPAKAISYASSTDNIARLLKQWVKKPSKSEGSSKCSSSTQNSSHNEVKMECAFGEEVDPKCGIDLSMAFESLFGFEFIKSSNSDEFSRSASPGIFHGESKPVDQNGFASMLENWPFDDQGRDYLTNLSFDENLDLY